MIQYITSAKNPQIQHIKQLVTTAKYRQKHRETVLDGVHLCDAFLRAGGIPEQVIVGMGSLTNKEVSELLFRVDESVPIIEVPESLYERMSSLEQGVAILFVIAMPEKRIAATLESDALILDRVQDPGNVGALARTLYALGGGGIILPRHEGARLGPGAAKASAATCCISRSHGSTTS